MKLLMMHNLENGKWFYFTSRGDHYSAVSRERFRSAMHAYFDPKPVLPSRYRSGPYELIEFVSAIP